MSNKNIQYTFYRIGVVICSITATVYYGGLCTQKYISDPVTVLDEVVPLESLPPLKWSICKPVYLTNCTVTRTFDLYTFEYIQDSGKFLFSLSSHTCQMCVE